MLDPTTLARIRDGIRAELHKSTQISRLKVTSCRREGSAWVLRIDTDKSPDALKESLEGASAYWNEPEAGGADVLAVLPETGELVIRFASSQPPAEGDIRLAPLPFLRPLLELYQDEARANACFDWLEQTSRQTAKAAPRTLRPGAFPDLRRAQIESFELPAWRRAFLWGPPGTGKTYTLGRMIAQHLDQFPNDRILFLSMTNNAVDLGIVAADDGVGQLGRDKQERIRKAMFRVGNRFVASRYNGRDYLLPQPDEETLEALVALEAAEPPKESVAAYAEWKEKIEYLREKLRTHTLTTLAKSRLAGMTTALCLLNFEAIQTLPPFDWIVVDEASQVGLVIALAVAQLGRRVLFAGDPRQLAPIVVCDHPESRAWLGRSIFEEMDEEHASTTLLDEQSRMAEPICDIVSNVFYHGKLRVADDAKADPQWIARREPLPINGAAANALIEPIADKATWSRKYNGPIRWESVQRVGALVARIVDELKVSPADVLVVTPFNAQRSLIRQHLRRDGLGRVDVTTVHRAQGGERHTVVFDPVDGSNPFFQLRLDSRRLINVAISRAQAHFILMLSPEDRRDELLNAIACVLDSPPPNGVESVCKYALRPDFPACVVGLTLRFNARTTGTVEEVTHRGEKLVVRDAASGLQRTFQSDILRDICRRRDNGQ